MGLKLDKDNSYEVWYFEIYYDYIAFPNAKLEKYRKPMKKVVFTRSFKTKESAKKFADNNFNDIIDTDTKIQRLIRKSKLINKKDLKINIVKRTITPIIFD